MMRLGRRYRFSASHRLHSPALSARENAEIYGKCNNPHGHGHDYVLEIGVGGPMEEGTGRVIDVARLDRLVEERVLRRLRHRNLSAEAPDVAGAVPTTESLTAGILRILTEAWTTVFPTPGPRLLAVRVQETRRNTVEIPVSQ